MQIVKSIRYAEITKAGAWENLINIDDSDVKNVPAKTMYFDGVFILTCLLLFMANPATPGQSNVSIKIVKFQLFYNIEHIIKAIIRIVYF